MRKQVVLISLVVIVLCGVLGWRLHAQNAYKQAPSGGSAVVEGVQTYVMVRTGGRLTEVLVEEGDAVGKGQPVARIDCVEQQAALRAALARVRSTEATEAAARAQHAGAKGTVAVAFSQISAASAAERALAAQTKLADKNKKRAEELHEGGAVATSVLDEAETRREASEEQRRAAEANAQTARAQAVAASRGVDAAAAQIESAAAAQIAARADVTRAELAVAECTLVAPRDGVVTARLLEPGSVVGPGSRVLTLVDTSTARVIFFLPNAELGRVQLGAPAQVRVDAFAGQLFAGTVRRIAAEAEFTPRNVQTREDRDRLVYAVEVHVDNAKGPLRAGMPAEVWLPGTER
jgi:HlyD family secretion protein